MSVGFEDFFPNLVFEKKDNKNYFFFDGDTRVYKYLFESPDRYEKNITFFLNASFGPWRVPESDHRVILDVMKKEKINTCEFYLRCNEGKETTQICTIPYLKELHDYFSKGNL